MTTTLKIDGMSCNHCVQIVTETLLAVVGVTAVRVDLEAGSAEVDHDNTDVALFKAAIEDAGYDCV